MAHLISPATQVMRRAAAHALDTLPPPASAEGRTPPRVVPRLLAERWIEAAARPNLISTGRRRRRGRGSNWHALAGCGLWTEANTEHGVSVYAVLMEAPNRVTYFLSTRTPTTPPPVS
ncbi:MAG: hypothetical protein ACYCZN_09450 [Candidatus Dormibacteria bacterium]